METTINGVKTNYVVIGEGKPFLILHGWGSNIERWMQVADPISRKGFKVIIPDLPGFGNSEALQVPWDLNKYVNWADEFIRQLELKDFYLMGHSFGGSLALKIAIKHAQEVKKLFLVSAAVVRTKTTKKNLMVRASKFVKIFNFLPYYYLFRKAVYKFIIRKSDYIYTEGVMKQTYLNVVREDLSFQSSFIKVPTIIIWGDKDDLTPLENARLMNEKIRNSKLVIISGAGHDLNRKQPEVLAQKIIENI